MIGYDPIKRDNYFHKIQLRKLMKGNLISEEEYQKLSLEIGPSYKETNIFINVGLFVFTYIILSSGIGLMALIFSGMLSEKTFWFFSFLTAVILFLGLEKVVIENSNQFRTGIDDAVLYGAMLFTFIGFFLLFENSLFNKPIPIVIFMIVFFGIPARIYFDRLLFGLTLISILSLEFFIFNELGGIFLLFIPFVTMGLSYLFFWFSGKQIQQTDSEAKEQCWEVVQWLSILSFYLSGNIFIVTELSTELGLADAFPEPVRWLFYAFTIVIPIYYIYRGLIKKDLSFVNIGLGTLAIGIFAIRYYHSILDIEYALLVGGLALIGIAWLAIKYIKNINQELSVDAEDADSGLKLESLIIDQAFGKVGVSDNKSFSGKGGEFGGGGGTGSF